MSTGIIDSHIERTPELLGQTVVVIRGSAGIGLETARRARTEGAKISGKFKQRGCMSYEKTVTISEAQEAKVRPHQPGESVFKSILAEDVDWKPFPAFPPSVHLAVIVGQPSDPGVYTIRVKGLMA